MRTAFDRIARAIALTAALAHTPLAAQITDASAVTLGLAGTGTATARGLAALSMNPAGLGIPGGGFSLTVLPVQLRAGLHPVTLADLDEWGGVLLPDATKEEWLARVTDDGSQSGAAGVDVTAFALTTGRIGFQLSTVAVASMGLAPDIVELVLFGNAGRTGTPADLTLGGSVLDGFAVTTASASMGFPLSLAGGSMSLGATLKYSMGHVVAVGREGQGSVSSDPLQVEATFPVVVTAEDADDFRNGSGVGLDLGVQLERGAFGFGAAVLNLVNSFAWDDEALAFRPGTVFVNVDSTLTEFDEQPFANAPAALSDAVHDLGFNPIVAVGAAYRAAEELTFSADVRKRLGDGLSREPALRVGVGAEYGGLRGFGLRGGVAAVTGGVEVAGGTSVGLGPLNISVSGALRRGDEDATLGQLTVSFGGR